MSLNFQENNGAPRHGVLSLLLFVLSVALCVGYAVEGDQGPLHKAQAAAGAVSAPASSAGANLGAGLDAAQQASDDAAASEGTLSALREQNEQLRAQVAQLEEYRQEVGRLQGLLKLTDSYNIQGVSAHVIARSGEAYSQTVSIDMGSDSGICPGQTVMGPTGVVGQVVSAAPTTSVVRLLSDPQSGAAVMVQSSRAEGVVRGSLDGTLYLECVDAEAKVSVGDALITSGLGGSYTRGLMVGTVARIDDSQGGASRQIIVAPNEETGPLQEVTVVLGLNGPGEAGTQGEGEGQEEPGEGGDQQ
ncbi:MAG: rod shape-determining protein MreC [Coriobacteriia bacterium]|nr:rod shape-determining protein MreC [Coriobacteriia bacterium]